MFQNKIWVDKNIQPSINIAYDLYDESKILNFIPTESTMKVIEEIILSTGDDNTNRARILIGAYGKGKSHIVLVIIMLLANYKNDITVYKHIMDKIKIINLPLYNYVTDYISNEEKILPIIINGSSTDLMQSFLIGLQESLKNQNLSELFPATNFKSAINTLKLWRDDFPQTFVNFKKSISTNFKDFVAGLRAFDTATYKEFTEIFPKLTSGMEFNPFVNVDVIELYESVAKKLQGLGYKGIYVVYDEFSKYLESSINSSSINDTKLLQDFAEKCNRSKSNQIHLLLISHKDIENYIDKNLPKDKVDGWRGISGRFSQTYLRNEFSQSYELIGSVIKKEPKFFKKLNKNNQFNKVMEEYFTNILSDKDVSLIKNCYPMHPISTFILPRLSEKVAQNERTLFTFLSSNEKHTLNDFLITATDELDFLMPDYIYDYFEPLFRKEINNSEIYTIYSTANRILKVIGDNSVESKALKTISLIYMIECFEELPPTLEVISKVYVDDFKIIKKLVENNNIIYKKRSNGYLKIKEGINFNIHSKIDDQKEKIKVKFSLPEILNKTSMYKYLYPNAYNDEMEITRYFDFNFITGEECLNISDWHSLSSETGSTGKIFAVIPNSQSQISELEKYFNNENIWHERFLVILPKKYINVDEISYEYYAIQNIREEFSEDIDVLDELDILEDDVYEILNKYISSYINAEWNLCQYFYSGNSIKITRKSQISAKLSEICFDTYVNTPIINNEVINKDKITTIALNSRNKLITGLLTLQLMPNLGLKGSGQDVSFMRSILINTGILFDLDTEPKINLNVEDEKLRQTLNTIKEFFICGESGANFQDLYDTLTLSENGYGLKKGIIPILLAVVIYDIKKYIIIKSDDKQMIITVDLINSINENPDRYTVYFTKWDSKKSDYIDSLVTIFDKYIIEEEKEIDMFSFVVLAMNRWYMNLPKYTKKVKNIYKGTDKKCVLIEKQNIKYLTLLQKIDINSQQFLFSDILDIFNIKNDDYSEVLNAIKDCKNIFDNIMNALIKHLISDIKIIFSGKDNKSTSLKSVMQDFVESLNTETIEHLYPNNEEKIINLILNMYNNEQEFIDKLAVLVTGLRINDWNYELIGKFTNGLVEIKNIILEFNKNATEQLEEDKQEEVSGYKLQFCGTDGNLITKTFDKVQFSNRGQLLKNEISIALEEMGQAISENEKRQILISFIENMC